MANVAILRAFPRDSGDDGRAISFLAGALTDPLDDLFVAGLAGGDALDHAGIGLDVGRSPLQAVGVEESRGEQERGALVGVGEWMVLREVLKQDGGLLGGVGYASTPPNDANGACSADSASVMRGRPTIAARSAPSRYAAMSM
jgi:hypothetical protein